MTQNSTLQYNSQIEGLRAIAVTGVLIFHLNNNWLPGGFVGVDVFFVISGYLISRIIFFELETNQFSLLRFYIRRVKRLFPALICVIFATWAIGWFWLNPSNYGDLGRHMNYSSFFFLNFRLMREGGYFDISSDLQPLRHLWSLCIEEQFYIVWPLLSLLLFRFKFPSIYIVGLIVCISFIYCLYQTDNNPILAYYEPWSRAWELGAGALLARTELNHADRFRRAGHPRSSELLLIVGLGGILMSMALFNQLQPFPGWRAIVPTTGAALVIFSGATRLGTRLLGNQLTRFLGRISYPLYLWHWPLIAIAHVKYGEYITPQMALGILLSSIFLSIMTYYLVELRLNVAFHRSALIPTSLLILLFASTGLLGMVTTDLHGIVDRFPPDVAATYDFARSGFADMEKQYPKQSQCLYDMSKRVMATDERRKSILDFYADNGCLTKTSSEKPTIAIVGDSHAGMLYSAIERDLDKEANILRLYAYFCAPMIENLHYRPSKFRTERCRALDDIVIGKLIELKPDVVLFSANYQFYLNEDIGGESYLDDIKATFRKLHAQGVGSILVVGQVPTWQSSLSELIADELAQGHRPSEFSNRKLDRQSLEIDRKLQSIDWGDGVRYISLAQQLCAESGCRQLVGTRIPDDLIYFDYGHLSISGSYYAAHRYITPLIKKSLGLAAE